MIDKYFTADIVDDGALTATVEDQNELNADSPELLVINTVQGNYITIPESGEVGQTIVVKEVDEFGKPTKWEAVDFPESEPSESTIPYIGDNGNWWVGENDTGVKAQGNDGYTPIKGKDYYTDQDVAELVNEVLIALPIAEGVGF